MKVYDEISLANFKAWAGAEENLNSLTYADCERLEAVLEDIYPDGIDATTLNDILRFDFNWCAHSLGYRNEVAARGNDPRSYAEHYELILADRFPAYADHVADYVANYLGDLTDEDENEERSEDRDDEAEDSFYYYLKDNPGIAGASFADIIREREDENEARAFLLLNKFSAGEKGKN